MPRGPLADREEVRPLGRKSPWTLLPKPITTKARVLLQGLPTGPLCGFVAAESERWVIGLLARVGVGHTKRAMGIRGSGPQAAVGFCLCKFAAA